MTDDIARGSTEDGFILLPWLDESKLAVAPERIKHITYYPDGTVESVELVIEQFDLSGELTGKAEALIVVNIPRSARHE